MHHVEVSIMHFYSERDSNPYSHYWPRDFQEVSLLPGLCLLHALYEFRRLVYSLYTFKRSTPLSSALLQFIRLVPSPNQPTFTQVFPLIESIQDSTWCSLPLDTTYFFVIRITFYNLIFLTCIIICLCMTIWT